VRSIIGLAHNLGLEVVAEGVEDSFVLGTLAALGCDQAQGYLIAKPMPFGELTGWVKQSAAGGAAGDQVA
jgi:EAL domain-containing protein (putative c-di-GMP-specific phosphodiesterase class I)